MEKRECKNCNKLKEISLSGKSEGLCHVCYKKLIWKPKLIVCKRCRKERPMHAKELCNGCYSSTIAIKYIRAHNNKRRGGVPLEIRDKIISKCAICDFSKMVDLHHLDNNHKNNSPDNLVGLCPNHHKMAHHQDFNKEITRMLKEKGFKAEEMYPTFE